MLDYIVLGSTPSSETCTQVSKTNEYLLEMREECQRYREMLEKRFPIPEGLNAFFSIRKFCHDFGSYYEVVIVFDDENETSSNFAYFAENNLPDSWEDKEIYFF